MAYEPDLDSGFKFGPFSVLPERNILWSGEKETHLEPKQMKALVTLARHQPGVVSKQMLIDEVWNGRNTSDESITGCIKGLRAALDNDNPRTPKYVETIHGRGYRLMVPLILPEEPLDEITVSRNWLPGLLGMLVVAAFSAYFFLSPSLPPESAQIDSVVITQFSNLSSEATQPTVDGITEQVISTLYEVPDLKIKKGNLPSNNESARDIADRYAVEWVVLGSVQQMNGQIKIIARIDDRDSVVEWAGTFMGTDKEIFDLHEQVATAIRDEIRGEEDAMVSAPSKPANAEAYDKYLLGQFYLAKRDKASLDQAAAYLTESIETDAAYGPAYLDLANTYMLLADYSARKDMFDLAIATVEEGVLRDPQISDAAQTVHGYVNSKRGNWLAASKAFQIATNSAAEYPPSHHYHSQLLAAVGRVDDSLEAAIRAWEMEPDSQVLNSRLAITYFWRDDMENARRFYDIAIEMGPGSPIFQLSYALFLIRDNNFAEAREVVRRAMHMLQAESNWVDPVFDELETSPKSEKLIDMLEEYATQNAIPANVLMTFWAIIGQPDRAMKIAWQLVDNPGVLDIELIYLKEFAGMRQHEDFRRLTEELGLVEYWQSVNCRWDSDQLRCPQD